MIPRSQEGMCYGKLESILSFFVWPVLLLGHLSGALSPDAERGVLSVAAALLAVMAARKYGQPVQADVGDKSVFEHLNSREDAASSGQ